MRGVTVQLASAVAHGFISTRTPHTGSDDCYTPADVYECVFQPALPMRGVTAMVDTLAIALSFQPALPMRGVTTHQRMICLRHLFQPALPMRGVT